MSNIKQTNDKLKSIRTAIIMLELKKEYLSFSHKDELELKRLKEYYNTLSKGK